MSYRAPEQALEEPIQEILDGIRKFQEATEARARSREWKPGHMMELWKLAVDMVALKQRLIDVQNSTW